MKQLAAILLMIAFMAQSFNQAFTVAAFYGNRAAYAKNCINKYRPQLHCNGRCQLMKKLKAQEQKEQQGPERKLENKQEVFLSKSFYDIRFANRAVLVLITTNHFSAKITDRSYSFFRPPQC